MDVECGECDKQGIDDPACSRVRRGLVVGNHEEGEDQQRTAFNLVQWDCERVAEPQRSNEQQTNVETKKGECDIGSCRPGDDHTAETGDQKTEPSHLPPLPRRDPAKTTGKDHDECDVCGVKYVLFLPPDDELAGYCNKRRQHGYREIIGTKQEAEREGGNHRTLGIEEREVEIAGAGILGELGNTERDDDVPDRNVEVEEEKSIEKEG